MKITYYYKSNQSHHNEMVYTFLYNLHSSNTTTFIGLYVPTIGQARIGSNTHGKSKVTRTLLPDQTSHPYSSTSCLLPDQSLKLPNNLFIGTSFLQRLTCVPRHIFLFLSRVSSPNATAASFHPS